MILIFTDYSTSKIIYLNLWGKYFTAVYSCNRIMHSYICICVCYFLSSILALGPHVQYLIVLTNQILIELYNTSKRFGFAISSLSLYRYMCVCVCVCVWVYVKFIFVIIYIFLGGVVAMSQILSWSLLMSSPKSWGYPLRLTMMLKKSKR